MTASSITDAYVVIVVKSESQNFTLYVGNEIKVDVDKNGVMDLSVQLVSIDTINKKANLFIKRISTDSKSPTGNAVADTGTSAGESTGSEGKEQGLPSGKLGLGNYWMWIIVGIIIVIVIVVISIIFVIVRNKDKKKKKWY